MKNIIDLEGVITKNNNKEISEEECNAIMDDILELLGNKGYCFGGTFNLISEDEID